MQDKQMNALKRIAAVVETIETASEGKITLPQIREIVSRVMRGKLVSDDGEQLVINAGTAENATAVARLIHEYGAITADNFENIILNDKFLELSDAFTSGELEVDLSNY